MDEIREKAKKYLKNEKIEETIYNKCEGDINFYCIYLIKALTTLKFKNVTECINNNLYKAEDIIDLEKDIINPEKWQKMLPKEIEKKRGLYKCKKCGSFYTTYKTVQTRSADEPATVYITCTDCEYITKC